MTGLLKPGVRLNCMQDAISYRSKTQSQCIGEASRLLAPTEIIIIIIIIIIITIINCNWVVTRWQWLFYMYTKHEIGY